MPHWRTVLGYLIFVAAMLFAAYTYSNDRHSTDEAICRGQRVGYNAVLALIVGVEELLPPPSADDSESLSRLRDLLNAQQASLELPLECETDLGIPPQGD
jgi:hypothetical protein